MKDMLGRDDAICVKDGIELIIKNLPTPPPEEHSVSLEDSYGRVLSRDVSSPEDLPSFSRSTVDGFAVIAEDTFGQPSYLAVCGEVLMGEEPRLELKRGQAAKIATGGMLPQGANAVVMLEHAAHMEGGMIEVLKPVAPGGNIIAKAEDVKKGQTILTRGRRLRPQDVAVMAGLGIKDVFVYEKPCVSIISTGDEIVPHTACLKSGFIRDMNSFTLKGAIEKEGGIALKKGILKDDYALIESVVRESLKDSRIILITGGSSVGTRDLTAKIISNMGRLLFHGVSMKPGKPTMAGIINDTVVFGIPGHPAAVMICFEVFIKPALRLLSGLAYERFLDRKNRLQARLTKSIRSASGKEEYFRVSLHEADGEVLAVPVLGKSGLISTLVKADGVVSVLPQQLGIEEGEMVEVRLF